MIYLVSRNRSLFAPSRYTIIDFEAAMNILIPLKIVQLDTETEGLDCHTKKLLTLQLGCRENQVVFDWTTLTAQEKAILKDYLESDRLFLGHNLMFDLTFLYKQDIWPKNIYDTMIAEQLIYLGFPRIISASLYEELGLDVYGYEYVDKDETGRPIDKPYYNLSYSLKATADRRIHVDIDKTVRGQIINEGLTEDVVVYAGGDVMWLEPIKDAQEVELAKQDLHKAVKFECEFIKSLAYVKFCGVHLDAAKWKAKMASDQANLEKAIKDLNDYVVELDKQEYITRYATNSKEREKLIELKFERYPEGDNPAECWRKRIKGMFAKLDLQGNLFTGFDTEPQCTINWSSHQKQVVPLFELLGIQVKTFDKKTKREKKSVEEKQIAPQADQFPIIPKFLKYQEYAKVVSTYGENWLNAINSATGRIHVELHSIGTDTGKITLIN